MAPNRDTMLVCWNEFIHITMSNLLSQQTLQMFVNHSGLLAHQKKVSMFICFNSFASSLNEIHLIRQPYCVSTHASKNFDNIWISRVGRVHSMQIGRNPKILITFCLSMFCVNAATDWIIFASARIHRNVRLLSLKVENHVFIWFGRVRGGCRLAACLKLHCRLALIESRVKLQICRLRQALQVSKVRRLAIFNAAPRKFHRKKQKS